MRKLLPCLLLAAGMAVMLGGCSSSESSDSKPASDEAVSWLLIQNSESGSLVLLEDDRYLLTLNNVPPFLVVFSDRPERYVDKLSTLTLASFWDDGAEFAQDPPNAALQVISGENDVNLIILELLSAVYDHFSGDMEYIVRPLETDEGGLASFNNRTGQVQQFPESFEHTVLFVDTVSVTANISGSVTDAGGDVLPGAVISAEHEPTGTRYEAVSRADGEFRIFNVRVGGPYSLSASMPGFRTQVVDNLFLKVAQTAAVHFSLELDTVEEEL